MTGIALMGWSKLAERLADYRERLEAGKVRKIETGHVEKVLDKLRRKEAVLLSRIAAETDREEHANLHRKLQVARLHITRAEWLLRELP